MLKYSLRQKNEDFAVGTTDLRNSHGSLIDTNGFLALLVTSGHGVASINFRKRALHKGCFTLLFYDSTFSIEHLSEHFTARYVACDYALVEEAVYKPLSLHFWDILYENPVFRTSTQQQALLCNWWQQVEWIEPMENKDYRREMLKACIRNLLMAADVEVMRNDGEKLYTGRNHAQMLLNRFYFLVATHCHEVRDVSYYANRLSITTTYLYKLCRKNVQLSPKEIIDKQVVTEIKTYLANSDTPIKSIATKLHFEDVSYLCRYFKRLTGMSPLDYRNVPE